MYLYVVCMFSFILLLLKEHEVVVRIPRHRFMRLLDKMSWTVAVVFTLRVVSAGTMTTHPTGMRRSTLELLK